MFPLTMPRSAPDLVTPATLVEVDHLRRHPDVRHVDIAPAQASEGAPLVTVALWIAEVSDADYQAVLAARRARGRTRPNRPPDMEFCGETLPPATFFDRMPDLEAYAGIAEPEEPYWAAKVWLTKPLAAPAA